MKNLLRNLKCFFIGNPPIAYWDKNDALRHVHIITPKLIGDTFTHSEYTNYLIFIPGGRVLNHPELHWTFVSKSSETHTKKNNKSNQPIDIYS
jgi:hypothetical protein